MYEYEVELVQDLVRCLATRRSVWGRVVTTQEFDFNSGRTDVLALDRFGELVAFEAKLTRWRDALHQAYRNQAFAHRCYVVLPPTAARLAGSHAREFERRGVGLCSVISPTCVDVIVPAKRELPLQPWLSEIAVAAVERNGGSCANHGRRSCVRPHRPRNMQRA